MMKKTLLFFLACFTALTSHAQISYGGSPPGLDAKISPEDIPTISLSKPELPEAGQEKSTLKPLQTGVGIPVSIEFMKEARATTLKNGLTIRRLKITSADAKAIGLYYSSFKIPEGGRLFLYDPSHQKLLGAFNHINNSNGGCFATEPVPGSEVILEYVQDEDLKERPEIIIHEVAYFYRHNNFTERGFGDSGPCEVNINCPEGDTWQEQKKGVAKIILKQNSGYYLCTGSLVNNARLDNKPYFLTANHCGRYSSTEDYDQWLFMFNYEAAGCEDPILEPASQSITGSQLRAKSVNNEAFGSDFKLLEFNDPVPDIYDPYYNGWTRAEDAAVNGVGIHHPQGDIKKISTYNEPVISSDYEGTTFDPDGLYWRVYWSETETNYGVTEGGSSGSPLFNEDGLITGALTGGAASCNNPDGPDYYGKFSYSWESNGNYDSLKLKPFLDPDNTGISSLPGTGPNINQVIALFKTSTDTIGVGESIQFTDLSSGQPFEWIWTFEGGDPAVSTLQNPLVKYSNFGSFDVSLIVNNEETTDTLTKKNAILVKPRLSPNPANDHFELYFGETASGNVEVTIYDMTGRKMGAVRIEITSKIEQVEVSALDRGLYFVEVKKDGKSSINKLMIVKSSGP